MSAGDAGAVVLDEQAWQRFAALFGEDPALEEIVELFIAESTKLGARIVEGSAEQDLDKVRRAAHSLKSTSHHVGALDLSSICRSLEALAQEGDAAAVRPLAATLQEQLPQVHLALRGQLRL